MTTMEPNAYLKTKVMTASPAELRLLLIDGAIRFAEQARTGLEAQNFEQVYLGITQCQEIIMELINALDHAVDPMLCERLQSLYIYIYTQLMEASTARDITIITEIVDLLRFERETWVMVMDRVRDETAQSNQAAAMSPARAHPGIDAAALPKVEPKTPGASVPEGLIGGTISING